MNDIPISAEMNKSLKVRMSSEGIRPIEFSSDRTFFAINAEGRNSAEMFSVFVNSDNNILEKILSGRNNFVFINKKAALQAAKKDLKYYAFLLLILAAFPDKFLK